MNKLNQNMQDILYFVEDRMNLFENEQEEKKVAIYDRESDYDRNRMGYDVDPIAHLEPDHAKLFTALHYSPDHHMVDQIIKPYGVDVEHGKQLYGWEQGGAHMKGGTKDTTAVHPSRLRDYKDNAFSHVTGHHPDLAHDIRYTMQLK